MMRDGYLCISSAIISVYCNIDRILCVRERLYVRVQVLSFELLDGRGLDAFVNWMRLYWRSHRLQYTRRHNDVRPEFAVNYSPPAIRILTRWFKLTLFCLCLTSSIRLFFFFISGKHILDDNAYFSFPFYLCVFLILFYVSFSSVVAESILVGAQDCPQTGVFTRRAGFNLGTIQRKKEKKKKNPTKN